MIATAREMEMMGIKAVMGNCGFNAIFQQELADAVSIPLFSSSLIQVPMVHQMLRREQKVGILTADKVHLTQKHLESVGIEDSSTICIAGIEETSEFFKIRSDPDAPLNIDKFGDEVLEVAYELISKNQEIGAIVLECTDLPPFAAAIRRSSGLPVFDIVTLGHYVYESISGNRWD
jgi:Asp/Glu/hydantoin racemase